MDDSRDRYKTALEWQMEGRLLKNNQRPTHYLVSKDGAARHGLYTRSQTVEMGEMVVVTAMSQRPKVKKPVRYWYDGEVLQIHVGNRKALQGPLKKAKYAWNPKTGRWSHPASPDVAKRVMAQIRDKGYTPVRQGMWFS